MILGEPATGESFSTDSEAAANLLLKAVTPEAGSGAGPAERALSRLAELSADLRAAAIVSEGGEVLASTGPGGGWADQAKELIDAATNAIEGKPDRVHVGTLDGEVFAVPGEGRWCVAITERFTLGSLVIFDMRMILRELDRELAEVS